MSQTPGIEPDRAPTSAGCSDCDAAAPQTWWFHLRRCAECGNVGCCDSSPNQHATAHFKTSGHRYMQSFEPGEDWFFDFETGDVLEGPELAAPTSHPEDQSTPGPAGRVPHDWQVHLNQ